MSYAVLFHGLLRIKGISMSVCFATRSKKPQNQFFDLVAAKQTSLQPIPWVGPAQGATKNRTVMHRGYAVVCLSPVIEAVGVTSIWGNACNSDCLDHRA